MEIAESIAVAAVAPTPDGPCWYCKEEPKGDLKNQETADPETSDSEKEDDVPENDEDNDSSKLGDSLGGSPPQWLVQCPTAGTPVTVVMAAHHCIPGGASLAKATSLHPYMREGDHFNSDIGYNVNCMENGVWLPGNYGVRKGKDHYSKDWGDQSSSFKTTYAESAMDKIGDQFHDAHPKYNGKVKKTLESIAAKLGKPDKKCPVCDDPIKKGRPPFGLVGRLHFVSGEHRTMITGLKNPDAKKFAQAGYFTSSRVKTYFGIV